MLKFLLILQTSFFLIKLYIVFSFGILFHQLLHISLSVGIFND